MKKIYTSVFILSSLVFNAQNQLNNGGFENWDNAGTSTEEPMDFNSNKTGSNTAQLGPQTCYRDATVVHGGSYSCRVETKYYVISVVNGNVTTGVVNAPSSNKSEGYIGTVNYSNSSDVRRVAFTARPDSIVGYYQYSQATSGTNASQEQGKVIAWLHSGDFNDPKAPVNSNHPDLSANEIGTALFVTPQSNVGVWTRFSVPFTYQNNNTPAYIMLNITSSNNQLTTAPGAIGTGSKLWVDDISFIYNTPSAVKENVNASDIKVWQSNKLLNVDLTKIASLDSEILLYDLTGKVLLSKKLETGKLNAIDLPAAGLVVYQISSKGTVLKNGKLSLQ